MKRVKSRDLEDLVFRSQSTYHEIVDILDVKYNSTKRLGCTLKPNIYILLDLNNTLKNILPDNVVSVTIDERKYESNLKINQTLIFTNKGFF